MGIQERKARLFQEREREILAAALDLFRKDDWQAVTIEEIAAHAEIGKGTIYKHFASKRDIYASLALQLEWSLLEDIRRIDTEQDALNYLRKVIRVLWEAHMSSREYHRVFQYCHQEGMRQKLSPEIRKRLDQLNEEINACLEAALRRGQETGIFPSISTPLMLFGPRSALWGAVDIAWSGCLDLDTDAAVEQITRFILAGLMNQDDPRVRGAR